MKRALAYLTALSLLLLTPAAAGPAAAASTTPTTADGFTQMFAAKNDTVWSGGAQATTVRANGFTYWLFGDSMTSAGENPDGSYPAGARMVSNRILLQRGGDLVNAVAGGGLGIPDPPTHTEENLDHYWPQAGFYTGGFLYVLAQRVQADPGDAFGFKSIGVEMAKFRIRTDGLLTFAAMIATPSTGVPGGVGPAGIQWSGDALVRDGYVYVYGAALAGENDQIILHFTYVARVPVGKVEQPSAWRYWAASRGYWVTQVGNLDPTPGSQPDAVLPSQVSSVRYIGGKYVLAHKPWNGWGDTVHTGTSASPVGPWTRAASLPAPASTWEGREYLTYSPQLHPEQVLTSGRTLIRWRGTGKPSTTPSPTPTSTSPASTR